MYNINNISPTNLLPGRGRFKISAIDPNLDLYFVKLRLIVAH